MDYILDFYCSRKTNCDSFFVSDSLNLPMLRPNYPIRKHFTSLLYILDSSSLLNMSRISDNTRDLTCCHMPLENISIRQNRNLDIVRLSIFFLFHCLPFMHIFWKTCWVDLQVSSRNLL